MLFGYRLNILSHMSKLKNYLKKIHFESGRVRQQADKGKRLAIPWAAKGGQGGLEPLTSIITRAFAFLFLTYCVEHKRIRDVEDGRQLKGRTLILNCLLFLYLELFIAAYAYNA